MKNFQQNKKKVSTKYSFRIISSFLLLPLLFLVSCSSQIASSPSDIPAGSVSIKTPKVESWSLENGLQVIYYQKKDVPVVSGTLYVPRGALSDDSGIVGLSGVMVKQMREGGIPGMSPDEFDAFLDSKAAGIEASQDDEVTSISFYSLSEDFDDLIKTFSDVIQKPEFDAGRLSLWKKLAKEEIRRRKDSPDTMAALSFKRLIYGEGSPWYKPLTSKDVDLIKESKMKEMHGRLFNPRGAYLILSGDLETEIIKSEVVKYFSRWENNKNKPLERFHLTKDNYQPPKGIFVLESNFEQASVITGHRSVPRDEVDLYSQSLFNRVLGSSGFGSLLFKEVRERRGLAYSVYGGFSSNMTEGIFRVVLGTKADSSLKALSTTFDVLKGVHNEPLPDDLVEAARSSITNSFVFKYEDPAYAAQRPTLLSLYGFPSDYDEKFIEEVKALEIEDLKDFSKNNLDPDNLLSVIVGNVNAKDIKAKVGPQVPVCVLRFDEKPVLGECL